MKKLIVGLVALACMAGCSSQSTQTAPAEKPQPKPAEFDTGRVAMQRLYVAAHGWARDAQPYRLESVSTSDSNGRDGKSAIWRGSFASPTGNSTRPYTWVGSDTAQGISRGVTPGSEDGYSPSNSNMQVFDMVYLKIDSDKALETAQKHGGDKITDTPVTYVLDFRKPTMTLIWHVIYGAEREGAKLVIDVNATTGDFIHAEK